MRKLLAIAGVLVLAGCSASTPGRGPADGPTPGGSTTASTTSASPASSASPAASTSSTASTSPAAGPFSSTRSFAALGDTTPVWWSGFEIVLHGAVYDAAARSVTVPARISNTAPFEAGLGDTRTLIAVRTGGQFVPLSSATKKIPSGAAVEERLVFGAVPADFDLAKATLVLGGEDEHRAVVGFDDSIHEFDPIRPLTATPQLVASGTATTYAVTSARLLPAACEGTNPVDVYYRPLKASQLSVELVGTLRSTSSEVGGVPANYAALTGPNGLLVPAAPSLNEVLGADRPPVQDLHLCFPVPAGTHGPVTVSFRTSAAASGPTVASASVTLP